MAPEPTPHRVLVADPHGCVREGLKALINVQPDMRVVGEAHDGPTALALVAAFGPDVITVEPSLPGLDGARAVARLREVRPAQSVLVLTADEDLGAARRLLGQGARGYVLKTAPVERLVQAVRTVAAGGTYLYPEMGGDFELSDLEVQVLRFCAWGYSNKEIVPRLRVSLKTVETYKSRALKRLGLRSRVDLMRHAVRSGWLTDGASEPPVVTGRDGPPEDSTPQ